MTEEETNQANEQIRKDLRRYVTYLRTSSQSNNYSLVLSSLTRLHEYLVPSSVPGRPSSSTPTNRILTNLQNDGCKVLGKLILDCVWEHNQRKLTAIAASIFTVLLKVYSGILIPLVINRVQEDKVLLSLSSNALLTRTLILNSILGYLGTTTTPTLTTLDSVPFPTLVRLYSQYIYYYIQSLNSQSALQRIQNDILINEKLVQTTLRQYISGGQGTNIRASLSTEEQITSLKRFVTTLCVPENDDVSSVLVCYLLNLLCNPSPVTKGMNVSSASTPTRTLKPILMETVFRTSFSTVPTISSSALALYNKYRIYAYLTQDETLSLFVPVLQKNLKARGEYLTSLVHLILQNVASTVSLDSVFDDVFSSWLQTHLMNTKDDIRLNMVRTCRLLASHLTDPATTLTKLVTFIITQLTTKRSTVPVWQNRYSLIQTLIYLSKGIVDSFNSSAGKDNNITKNIEVPHMAKLAVSIIDFLISTYPKETNEITKGLMVIAIGHYFVYLPSNAVTNDMMDFITKGLKATNGTIDDGYYECIYNAITAGGLNVSTGTSSPNQTYPISTNITTYLQSSASFIDNLYDSVVRTVSLYLGSGKKPLTIPLGTLYGLATLVRLSINQPTLIEKLNQPKLISTEGSSGTTGGSSTTSTAAAKKPATTPTAAVPKAKGTTAPTVPSSSSSSSSSAGTAGTTKTYTVWDLFTNSNLTPLLVFHPSIIQTSGRTVTEVANNAPYLYVIIDMVTVVLVHHLPSVKLYNEKMITGVFADLQGTTGGNVRQEFTQTLNTASSSSASNEDTKPSVIPVTDTPTTGTPRKPNALFTGFLSLLSHPLTFVRSYACRALHQIYLSPHHSSLMPCLVHALWDKVRQYDIITPSGKAIALDTDTGIGNGPLSEHALAQAAVNGKLPNTTLASQATSSFVAVTGGNETAIPTLPASPSPSVALSVTATAAPSNEDDNRTFSTIPASYVLQACLYSILGVFGTEDLVTQKYTTIDTVTTILPVSLFLACHPALVGNSSDNDYTINAGRANAISSVLSHGLNYYDTVSYYTKGYTDIRNKTSGAVWTKVYTTLTRLGGYVPALLPLPGKGTDSSSSLSSSTMIPLGTLPLPVSQFDYFLQQETVANSIVNHLQSTWGIWSKVHTLRMNAAKVITMLYRGIAWMVRTVKTDTTMTLTAIVEGSGSGGRSIVLQRILPLLIETFADCNEHIVSEIEYNIWRCPEGKVYNENENPPSVDYDLANRAESGRMRRTQRYANAGTGTIHGPPDNADDPWISSMKQDIQHRKETMEKDAIAKAAIAAAKGKGGSNVLSAANFDFAPPPSGTKGKSGSGTTSSSGGKLSAEEIVAQKLRDQNRIRQRVQLIYSITLGSFYVLRTLCKDILAHAVTLTTSFIPLLPSLLPTLLPTLSSLVVQDHAKMTVGDILRVTLSTTSIAVPTVPLGFIEDWAQLLLILQGGLNSGTYTNTHYQPAGVAQGYLSLADEDGYGIVGANLTIHTTFLKRFLQTIIPRLQDRQSQAFSSLDGNNEWNSLSTGSSNLSSTNGIETKEMIKAQAQAASLAKLRPEPLSSYSFLFLYPILRAILTANPPLPFTQQAFTLLSLHVTIPQSQGLVSNVDQSLLCHGAIAAAEDAIMANAVSTDPIMAHSSSWDVQVNQHQVLSLPLGPTIADGTGNKDYGIAGIRYAQRILGTHASLLQEPAATVVPSQTSSYMNAAYLNHRILRESITSTILSVLRTSPRITPPPEATLLSLVRGGEDVLTPIVDNDTSASNTTTGHNEGNATEGILRMAVTSPHAPLLTFTLGEMVPLIGHAGLLSPFAHVRAACLLAIDSVLSVHAPVGGLQPLTVPSVNPSTPLTHALTAASAELVRTNNTLLSRLWLAVHDTDEDNSAHAKVLWSRYGGTLPIDFRTSLIPLLSHPDGQIRIAAGRAIAGGVKLHASTADVTIRGLVSLFNEYAEPIVLDLECSWRTREGIINALAACAEAGCVPPTHIPIVLPFLIQRGLPDDQADIRSAALTAGRALVDSFGASHTKVLLPVLETFLEQGSKSHLSASTEFGRDAQREGAVVLLGSTAKYLAPTDPKIMTTVRTLFETLDTPSEAVQKAVNSCLPPLAKAIRTLGEDKAASLVNQMKTKLFDPKASFAVRRGAAFGLGGLVRGFGLTSFRTYNLLELLETMSSDSKNEIHRQGAMFTYETLCESLGMLFEPYVTRSLPFLLKCVGDPSPDVREAASYAAKSVMGILTGHGVKLVMPAVLKGLTETAWRSKQASIQVLGAMSSCAPKQLSACLPSVVPKLVEAFEDPHPNVQKAGKEALTEIAKVIKNPEIQKLAPVLQSAVTDPGEKTKEALVALASTDFVHAIDPPSLALIVPILRRGLQERMTGTKIQAASAAGHMCALIADAQDLIPYLPQLMGPLRKTAVDPIPDVRAVAAKALGLLMKGLGEKEIPDLLPWLIETLQSEASTVDRSGGAQSLVEVLVALGEPYLSTTLASLLPLANHAKPAPKEGFLWTVVFLPTTMGRPFAKFVPRLFPLVLNCLADDSDLVRDVAARCSKTIITAHGKTDPEVVVPALEGGLTSTLWRIRHASVGLTGQLLNEIAGMPEIKLAAGNTTFPGSEGGNNGDNGGSGDGDDEEEDQWASDDDEDDLEPLEETPVEATAPEPSAKGGKGGANKGGKKGGKDDEEDDEASKAVKDAANKVLDKKGANKGGNSKKGGKDDDDKPEPSSSKPAKDEDGKVRRRKGERGVIDDEAHLPMQKKSNKIRQPSEAKLAQLAAEGRIEGLGPKSNEPVTLTGAMDAASQAQIRILGAEGRARLLGALYMTRSDTSAVVRQAALGIWKTVVLNTPRTLREILPSLITMIIRDLASTSDERRIVSGRCLGDIVRKLGERVLPEIIPILRRGLLAPTPSLRTGVCLGLTDVINAATRNQLAGFTDLLVPALRDALCDDDGNVRDAASRAFHALQRVIGQSAVDSVIPSLLAGIDSENEDERARAIAGLQNMVTARATQVLPTLLPQLLSPPLTLLHAQAVAAVASVCGSNLHFHVLTILPSLIHALAGEEPGCTDKDRTPEEVKFRIDNALGEVCGTILAHVTDTGVSWTLQEMTKYLNDMTHVRRRMVAAFLIQKFISNTKANILPQLPILLKELLLRFVDTDDFALAVTWEALNTLVTVVPIEETTNHLDFIRSILAGIVSDARFRRGGVGQSLTYFIPGFCRPKGLEAILPIYQRALMHGSAEARESAAIGIGELIELTTTDALKPLWVKITGPLIRIVADRFPWGVKSAILKTLGLIIDRGTIALRPFLPQLQASFVKALADPVAAVRTRGAIALGKLMPLALRIDPLVVELSTTLSTSTGGIAESLCEALTAIFFRGADKITTAARTKAIDTLLPLLREEDETLRRLAGTALGASLRNADTELLNSTLPKVIIGGSTGASSNSNTGNDDDDDDDDGVSMQVNPLKDGQCAVMNGILKYSPVAFTNSSSTMNLLLQHFTKASKDSHYTIRENAARGLGYALSHSGRNVPSSSSSSTNGSSNTTDTVNPVIIPDPNDFTSTVTTAYATIQTENVNLLYMLLTDSSPDVKKKAIDACRRIARYGMNICHVTHVTKTLLPALTMIVNRDTPNHVLRYEADRALVYWLGLKTVNGSSSVPLSSILSLVDKETNTFLNDYARRGLRRVSEEPPSDEEDNDA